MDIASRSLDCLLLQLKDRRKTKRKKNCCFEAIIVAMVNDDLSVSQFQCHDVFVAIFFSSFPFIPQGLIGKVFLFFSLSFSFPVFLAISHQQQMMLFVSNSVSLLPVRAIISAHYVHTYVYYQTGV